MVIIHGNINHINQRCLKEVLQFINVKRHLHQKTTFEYFGFVGFLINIAISPRNIFAPASSGCLCLKLRIRLISNANV